jgi:hypothetical protein
MIPINNKQKAKTTMAKQRGKTQRLPRQLISSKPRDPSSIINTLAKSMKQKLTMGPLSQYKHCRMYPFTAKGGSHIPDGGNSNFVVVDARTYDNISMGSGGGYKNFEITTFPAVPVAAFLNSKTAITVNGNAYSGGTNTAYPLALNKLYLGSSAALPGTNQDAYNCVSARFVTMAYRIIYTGPVNTCSGSITAFRNDIAFQDAGVTVPAADSTKGLAISVNKPDGTLWAEASNATNIVRVEAKSTNVFDSTGILSNDAVTVRPEEGMYIVLKHKTNNFKIMPSNEYYIPYDGDANFGAVKAMLTTDKLATPTYVGGLSMWDNDWSSVTIQFQNINSDASFRLETVVCMEINPAATSSVRQFTISPTTSNEKEVKEANNEVNAKPVALPAAKA